jgi:hypothetical protein
MICFVCRRRTFRYSSRPYGSGTASLGIKWLTGQKVSNPFAVVQGSPAFFTFSWTFRPVLCVCVVNVQRR